MNNTIDFLNQTMINTPSLRGGGSVNSTACPVEIRGWCTFSDGIKAGIIIGFIALILLGCCCYCATLEDKPNIYEAE
jgi:hypothetical protein